MRSLWLVLPLLALGCSSKTTTVTGSVTYNGQRLEYGHILFTPVDQKGPAVGGDILEGEYEIRDMPRGSKRVVIKAKPSPKRVPANDRVREHVEVVAPKDPIDPKAIGNDQVVEIQGSQQRLDFTLARP
jgi:hypothetical protein